MWCGVVHVTIRMKSYWRFALEYIYFCRALTPLEAVSYVQPILCRKVAMVYSVD